MTTATAESPALMSYAEAAEYLGLTLNSLRSLVTERENRARFHPQRIPGHRGKFLPVSDLDAYRRREPPSPIQTESRTGPSQPIEPQAIVDLARNMAESQLQTVRGGYMDMVAAAFAGNATLLATLLGNQGGAGMTDPKRYGLSLRR